MSTPIDLWKALTSEIDTRFPDDHVKRRYMPLNNSADLQELKISVYFENNQHEEIGRFAVTRDYTFGIAVQKAVSIEQTDIDGDGEEVLDGIDNLAFGDAVLEKVELIKSLWLPSNGVLPDGELRSLKLAGCVFSELVHEPVYESIHLITKGVYTAIVDVTYTES